MNSVCFLQDLGKLPSAPPHILGGVWDIPQWESHSENTEDMGSASADSSMSKETSQPEPSPWSEDWSHHAGEPGEEGAEE